VDEHPERQITAQTIDAAKALLPCVLHAALKTREEAEQQC